MVRSYLGGGGSCVRWGLRVHVYAGGTQGEEQGGGCLPAQTTEKGGTRPVSRRRCSHCGLLTKTSSVPTSTCRVCPLPEITKVKASKKQWRVSNPVPLNKGEEIQSL